MPGCHRPIRSYIVPMELLGELAALSTALLWAFTSIFFSAAGRRIGSFNVNKIRLLMAVAIYCLVLWATTGRLWSPDLTTNQLMWLALSGLIGLVFGDSCLFKAFVMIGPRLATLIYATTPIMTTAIAWIFLGETLGLYSLLGVALTIGGITWVVLERRYDNGNNLAKDHPDSGSLIKGVILGLGGALGQAVGLVLAKQAMIGDGADLAPMEASFLRMVAALVAIWGMTLFSGHMRTTLIAMSDKKAMGHCTGGSIVGPFLGVWLSLVAIKLIPTGIAATLNSMVPVVIIPLVVIIHKEKVSLRAILGAIISVAGVALLMLS